VLLLEPLQAVSSKAESKIEESFINFPYESPGARVAQLVGVTDFNRGTITISGEFLRFYKVTATLSAFP